MSSTPDTKGRSLYQRKDGLLTNPSSDLETSGAFTPNSIVDKEGVNVPEPNCLERVLSRTRSRPSSLDPGPPPDGGWQAWTQAFASHIVIFNTWGYVNSFGVFQTYYVAALDHPPSDISWVGSVQIFLLFFVGTFSGRATDAGYFRLVFLSGSFLFLLGVFMTSLSTQYWQFFLAQGVATGLGNGLLFCPTLTLLSTYFSKHRAVAIGIAASGSATGGLVFPAIVECLLPKIGFAWTMRVLGFVMLGLQAVAFACTKPRLPPRKSGPLIELSAFKELPYALVAIGMFFTFWGVYFPFYYIGSYSRDKFGVSQGESVNFLLLMNGVGLVGRLVPGYFSDRWFGPANTLIPFIFTSGLMGFCWAEVESRAGAYAFAAMYGISVWGVQGLFPATLSSLTSDPQKHGIRLGMVFSIIAFASLTGPPIAGALIQSKHGDYLHAQMFAGTAIMCGCLGLLCARFARTGFKIFARV